MATSFADEAKESAKKTEKRGLLGLGYGGYGYAGDLGYGGYGYDGLGYDQGLGYSYGAPVVKSVVAAPIAAPITYKSYAPAVVAHAPVVAAPVVKSYAYAAPIAPVYKAASYYGGAPAYPYSAYSTPALSIGYGGYSGYGGYGGYGSYGGYGGYGGYGYSKW